MLYEHFHNNPRECGRCQCLGTKIIYRNKLTKLYKFQYFRDEIVDFRLYLTDIQIQQQYHYKLYGNHAKEKTNSATLMAIRQTLTTIANNLTQNCVICSIVMYEKYVEYRRTICKQFINSAGHIQNNAE